MGLGMDSLRSQLPDLPMLPESAPLIVPQQMVHQIHNIHHDGDHDDGGHGDGDRGDVLRDVLHDDHRDVRQIALDPS